MNDKILELIARLKPGERKNVLAVLEHADNAAESEDRRVCLKIQQVVENLRQEITG